MTRSQIQAEESLLRRAADLKRERYVRDYGVQPPRIEGDVVVALTTVAAGRVQRGVSQRLAAKWLSSKLGLLMDEWLPPKPRTLERHIRRALCKGGK